ncbi:MAG: hypothetical protein LBM97_01170, partial [Candidatus Nomurabacteria bacterium]|nr:hypothetical protein [Candidatus Nomurabacteria bacterium]
DDNDEFQGCECGFQFVHKVIIYESWRKCNNLCLPQVFQIIFSRHAPLHPSLRGRVARDFVVTKYGLEEDNLQILA